MLEVALEVLAVAGLGFLGLLVLAAAACLIDVAGIGHDPNRGYF